MNEFFEVLSRWGEQETLSEPVHSLEESARRLLVDPSAGQAWLARLSGRTIGFVLVNYRWSVQSGGRVAYLEQIGLAPLPGVERFLPDLLKRVEEELSSKSIVKMEVSLKRTERNGRKQFFEEYGFLTQSVDLLEKTIRYEEEVPLQF